MQALNKTSKGAGLISSKKNPIGRPALEIPPHRIEANKTGRHPFSRTPVKKAVKVEAKKKYGSEESGEEDQEEAEATPQVVIHPKVQPAVEFMEKLEFRAANRGMWMNKKKEKLLANRTSIYDRARQQWPPEVPEYSNREREEMYSSRPKSMFESSELRTRTYNLEKMVSPRLYDTNQKRKGFFFRASDLQKDRYKAYVVQTKNAFQEVMEKDMASIASVPAEVVTPSLLNAFEAMRKRQILRQINQNCLIKRDASITIPKIMGEIAYKNKEDKADVRYMTGMTARETDRQNKGGRNQTQQPLRTENIQKSQTGKMQPIKQITMFNNGAKADKSRLKIDINAVKAKNVVITGQKTMKQGTLPAL